MKIEVDDSALQRALAALGERARDLTPMFREVGEGVKADAQLRFKDSQDPYGVAWKRLSHATLMARARRAAGGKSLKRDGTFKVKALAAFTTAKPLLDNKLLHNSIASDLLGKNGVRIGTNKVYAAVQQFGGGKSKIPARPYIATKERGLPREYGEILSEALNRHFGRFTQP